MNWRFFFIILFTVFLAELGDKTQLAVLTYTATEPRNKWWIFLGGSAALILSTFIAVILGSTASRFINPFWLQLSAAVIFIILGIFLLFQSFQERKTYNEFHSNLEAALESECRQCLEFWDYFKHFQEDHHHHLSAQMIQLLEDKNRISLQSDMVSKCSRQCRIKEIHRQLHKQDKGGNNVRKSGA